MDNDDVVVEIESRLKLMTQKMSQLVNSWNEQTRGLHLDSDGQLRGLSCWLNSYRIFAFYICSDMIEYNRGITGSFHLGYPEYTTHFSSQPKQ